MRKYIPFIALIGLISIPFTTNADVFAYIPDHVGDQNKNGLLHVVNASFNVKVDSIELFGNPRDVLIDKSGETVFVSTELEEDGEENSYINIISALSNTRIGQVKIDGNFARGMIMNSNGAELFITHDRGVSSLNPYSIALAINTINTINTIYRGASMAITEDDQYLIVIGSDRNGVDGVSLVSLAPEIRDEVSFISLGLGKDASSVIYIDSQNKLFVINGGADELVLLEIGNYSTPNSAYLIHSSTIAFEEGATPSDILYNESQNELMVSLSFVGDGTARLGNGYIKILNASDISAKPEGGLTAVFLSDEGGVDTLFDPIHPTAISMDQFGRIYVIKHIWNEFSGMYFSKLKVTGKEGNRKIVEERSLKLGERSSTLMNGTFIGPDCEACPTGFEEEDESTRPSSIDLSILFLFFILVVLRTGKGIGKIYNIGQGWRNKSRLR